jgi:hypothetical protein
MFRFLCISYKTYVCWYFLILFGKTFLGIYSSKGYLLLLLVCSFFYFLTPEIHIPSRLVVSYVPNSRDQDIV